MSNTRELLDEVRQALADLALANEGNSTGLAAIEQALSDLITTIKGRPGVNVDAVVRAISALKLVAPPVTINVPKPEVHLMDRPFSPVKVKPVRDASGVVDHYIISSATPGR